MQHVEYRDAGEDSLRARAEREDAASERAIALGFLWTRLMRGDLKVDRYFVSLEREFLILRPEPNRHHDESVRKKLAVLERIVADCAQKVTAFELGKATSTVSSAARQALAAVGLPCVPSRVPLLLVALARASHANSKLGLRVSSFSYEESAYLVASSPHPKLEGYGLSAGEKSVMRLVLRGHTYREIATQRGTSPRTVANQLASAFKRIGVSGRARLIEKLLSTEPLDATPPPSPPCADLTQSVSALDAALSEQASAFGHSTLRVIQTPHFEVAESRRRAFSA